MEIAKELVTVANEITDPVDVRRQGKNEHKKINRWKNGTHVTCHSELHNRGAAVGSGHSYKK